MTQALTNEELVIEMFTRGVFSDDWYDYFYKFDKARFDAAFLKLTTVIDRTPPAGLKGKRLTQWRGQKNLDVGTEFEELAKVILSMCQNIVVYDSNVKTDIDEIDFLIKKLPTANLFDVLRASDAFILGEAKCYSNNTFKGDWVAKIRTRMEQHRTNVAFLFVRAEKSPLNGKLNMNFVVNSAQGKYVIPLGLNCLKRIADGENFLKLITDHYISLKSYKGVAV